MIQASIFIIGTVIPMTWAILPPLWVSVAVMIVSCVFLVRSFIFPSPMLRSVGVFLLGLGWACYSGNQIKLRWPNDVYRSPVLVSGRLVSFPKKQPNQLSFHFLVSHINSKPCKPTRVLLTQYHFRPQYWSQLPEWQETWQLLVRLKKPRGYWNPGSFDYQAWLLQRKVSALGTIMSPSGNYFPKKLKRATFDKQIWRKVINYCDQKRNDINIYLRQKAHNGHFLGLLQALITGTRANISSSDWEVMRATGTSHLFSVSGLHIGFVGGLIYGLTYYIWSYIGRLVLIKPAQYLAVWGLWISGCAYGVLSGLELPAQRSIIMLTIQSICLITKRVVPVWQRLSITAVSMLLINPFVVLGPSFWLSFGAITIILYGSGGRLYFRKKQSAFARLWQSWGEIQRVLGIGLLSMNIWFFQQVSFVGLIANLFAVPWIGFVVLPLGMMGTVFGNFFKIEKAAFLLKVSYYALEYLWYVLTYLAHLSFSSYTFMIPSYLGLLSISISVLLLIAPRGFPNRFYFASIALTPLLFNYHPRPAQGEFWCTMLDVGQGLSVVVRTKNHVLVYDAGPKLSQKLDAGNAVILPFLTYSSLKLIDKLIISHGDSDHSGGMQSLFQSGKVKFISTSEPQRLGLSEACYCRKGETWIWDDVNFKILHPPSGGLKGNNASCVLQVKTAKHCLLLPGDIHTKGEKLLLKGNPDLKEVTVLVAPHHGSKTSSSKIFLDRLRPKYVLFAVGYNNRFGFPHSSIKEQYRRREVTAFSTDTAGAISIQFKNDPQPKIKVFREHNKRFWNNDF